MKVLILAGGYGTRLYPLIQDTPKALLDVAGKTLIDHTFDKFIAIEGIEEVVVVTNAKFSAMLSDWALRKTKSPFPIRIVNDGTKTPEERLGAIGDILFVLAGEKKTSDWIIVGSDNLFDHDIHDFVAFSQKASPSVTIGCYDINDLSAASKYGVIQLDRSGKIVSLQEKPKSPVSSLISMCMYFLPKATLSTLKKFIDETHNPDTTGGYIQWLYKNQSVFGFQFSGKWYDIGSIESYNEAQRNFLV